MNRFSQRIILMHMVVYYRRNRTTLALPTLACALVNNKVIATINMMTMRIVPSLCHIINH